MTIYPLSTASDYYDEKYKSFDWFLVNLSDTQTLLCIDTFTNLTAICVIKKLSLFSNTEFYNFWNMYNKNQILISNLSSNNNDEEKNRILKLHKIISNLSILFGLCFIFSILWNISTKFTAWWHWAWILWLLFINQHRSPALPKSLLQSHHSQIQSIFAVVHVHLTNHSIWQIYFQLWFIFLQFYGLRLMYLFIVK